jgi:hypothetical protein
MGWWVWPEIIGQVGIKVGRKVGRSPLWPTGRFEIKAQPRYRGKYFPFPDTTFEFSNRLSLSISILDLNYEFPKKAF